MSKFQQLYEELFKSATPEEVKRRQEEFREEEKKEWIEYFLSRVDIRQNPDGSYDVDNDVFMKYAEFTEIPLKFNKVNGSFLCGDSYITSLKGAPKYVHENFDCSGSDVDSLEYAPKYVGRNFDCSDCGDVFSEEEVRAVCDVEGDIYV